MNIIKNNVLGLIKIMPSNIPLLANFTGQKLILPFYHAVSNRNIPHIKHLYPVRSEIIFKKDLDFLLRHYKPIDLKDLLDIIEGKKTMSGQSFHLTFDDGLREVHDIVAPLLIERGIPATFFLNSAFVDNKNLFYRYKASLLLETISSKKYSPVILQKVRSHFKEGLPAGINNLILSVNYNNKDLLDQIAIELEVDFNAYLNREKPYLTTDQVKELMKKSFTIGAHSIDHPEFSTISLSDQINQVRKSMDFIIDQFKPPYHVFAFPFTDHGISKDFFESIFRSENPSLDLTFGTAGMKKDSIQRNIQRIPMEESKHSAKSIITMQYLYYLCKFPFGKNTIKRQ